MDAGRKAREGTMRKRMQVLRKTAGAAVLTAFILILSTPPAAAERTGANLKIRQEGGAQVSGELIGVSETALILKNAENGADFRILWEDISHLEIIKKSHLGTGLLLGALAGFASGVLIGAAEGESAKRPSPARISYFWGMTIIAGDGNFLKIDPTVVGGVLGTITGAALGGGIALAAAGRTYRVAGMSAQARGTLLKDLRSMARVPDYR
jgi:hypothetical protein